MIEVVSSGLFTSWLKGLRDVRGRAIILVRIERLAAGNLGDAKALGGGISELRIAFGPGYRVYYKRYGNTVVVLLAGGDKSSQTGDIDRARIVAREWEATRNGANDA